MIQFCYRRQECRRLFEGTETVEKSKLEIERKSFSRIAGAKLWNEIPTKLRTLPKLIFIRKIHMILFNLLESEDAY